MELQDVIEEAEAIGLLGREVMTQDQVTMLVGQLAAKTAYKATGDLIEMFRSTMEQAAQVCFERSNRWHEKYWEAKGVGDEIKAQLCAQLRDEAAACKSALRGVQYPFPYLGKSH